MPQTRRDSLRELLLRDDTVRLPDIPEEFKVETPFQRRYFTQARREKVARYLKKASDDPKAYGVPGSDPWMHRLLVEIKEPGTVSIGNVRDWAEKNPRFFYGINSKQAQDKPKVRRDPAPSVTYELHGITEEEKRVKDKQDNMGAICESIVKIDKPDKKADPGRKDSAFTLGLSAPNGQYMKPRYISPQKMIIDADEFIRYVYRVSGTESENDEPQHYISPEPLITTSVEPNHSEPVLNVGEAMYVPQKDVGNLERHLAHFSNVYKTLTMYVSAFEAWRGSLNEPRNKEASDLITKLHYLMDAYTNDGIQAIFAASET